MRYIRFGNRNRNSSGACRICVRARSSQSTGYPYMGASVVVVVSSSRSPVHELNNSSQRVQSKSLKAEKSDCLAALCLTKLCTSYPTSSASRRASEPAFWAWQPRLRDSLVMQSLVLARATILNPNLLNPFGHSRRHQVNHCRH